MSHTQEVGILEVIFEKYAQKLVSWAVKRFKTMEDAEDLCQEVMYRLYKAIIRMGSEEKEIQDIDKYLWSIAYSVLRAYRQDVIKKEKLINDSEIDLDIEMQIISEESNENSHNTDKLLAKLRKSIYQLDKNHREAMIMFHFLKRNLNEIGEQLGVSENYVKKLLFESCNQIRAKDKLGLYDVEREYKPNSLTMSFSGEEHQSSDIQKITDSLSRQNICLACYDKPKSLDELGEYLGLAHAYVEFDLKWLIERGFIKKLKNKYSTMFFILEGTFNAKMTNVFIKHKENCLDKIIDKLKERQSKIKALNFIGSEKSMNKLLWLLIYSFTDLATELTCFNELDNNIYSLARVDGGYYYPIGIFKTESKAELAPLFLQKYKEMEKWDCNGTYHFNDGGNRLSWLGLYNAGSLIPDALVCKETLFKVIKQDYKTTDLSDEEQIVVDHLIKKGYLSISKDKRNISPNFCVFTSEQSRELESILLEVYEEIKPEFFALYRDLQKMCKEYIPPQLRFFEKYISYYCLFFSHLYTTGFAFYDGKMYRPKSEMESILLTLGVTTSNKQLNEKQKITLRHKIYTIEY